MIIEKKEEKNKNEIIIFTIFFTLLSLVYLSCNDSLALNKDETTVTIDGYGTVRINFAGDVWQERTVFPTIQATDVFDKIEYFFTKQPDGNPEEKTPENGLFALEFGAWTVLVKAYIGEKQVAYGITEQAFTVGYGETVNLTIAFTPTDAALTGNGTFSYYITYPAGSSITEFKLNSLLSSLTIDLMPTDMPIGTVIEQSGINIPAGYYFLTVMMSKDGINTGKNEVVHIYDSMISTYNVEFVEIDFISIVVVQGETLAEKLSWLRSNAVSYKEYIIEVYLNEDIDPTTLSYSGRNNINIYLKGIDSTKTIGLTSNGSIFTVGSGVTLYIENIMLQGFSGNNTSLVYVYGTLIMNEGTKITDNKINPTYSINGGGLYVDYGGTFIMNGGEISNNSVDSINHFGGGVFIQVGGTFIMNGGKICNNNSSLGGGVNVSGGTLIMNDGEISSNTASAGGGIGGRYGSTIINNNIYRGSSTFIMNDGKISDNHALYGGGIWFDSCIFIMNDGEIRNNMASSGGGISISNNVIFTMIEGEIFNNTASFVGGGG